MRGADRFLGLLRHLEEEHRGETFGSHWEAARDFATAALILSFSAVETAVNEVLDDLVIGGELHALIERASPTDGAQAVLIHLGRPPMDRGRDPLQSLALLGRIRNALVHARGGWSDVDGDASGLSRRIASAGLPLSPFCPDPRWAFERGNDVRRHGRMSRWNRMRLHRRVPPDRRSAGAVP